MNIVRKQIVWGKRGPHWIAQLDDGTALENSPTSNSAIGTYSHMRKFFMPLVYWDVETRYSNQELRLRAINQKQAKKYSLFNNSCIDFLNDVLHDKKTTTVASALTATVVIGTVMKLVTTK